ncbi:MAG: hypothetical protein KC421_16020 [Anaerolineales bacterium]|nr:hypothetical protein [Anaerolineales bacterium]
MDWVTMLNIVAALVTILAFVILLLGLLKLPGYQKWLFCKVLFLYPKDYREAHGDELLDIFTQAAQEAVDRWGLPGVLRVVLGDIIGVVRCAVPMRVYSTLFLMEIILKLALLVILTRSRLWGLSTIIMRVVFKANSEINEQNSTD